MNFIFKSLAALTKTLSQALTLSGVIVLAILIHTGFTLPRLNEHPWLVWLSYINPVAYAFEALLVNEVHERQYPCASLVPPQLFVVGGSFTCAVAGAVPGMYKVAGDAWVEASYGYSYGHIW